MHRFIPIFLVIILSTILVKIEQVEGGVGLYLADNFDFKCRPDLVFSCTECAESLFVEINRPKEKNIIVGVVYRPPNQKLQNFMNSLDLLLASISKENKICYVVGDWNLDLIKHHCHKSTGEFLEIMYSRMFFSVDHTSDKVNFYHGYAN